MNKGLKNSVLAVATIIAVGCIIFGCARNFGKSFWGSWGKDGSFRDVFEDVEFGPTDTETIQLNDDVTNLKITMNLGDVTVKKGSENSVRIDYNKSALKPNVSCEKGTLTVSSPHANLSGFNTTNVDINVEITLRNDLENINADIDLGNMEIENFNISKKMDITLDLGDLKVDDCYAKEIDIQEDLGDIALDDVDFEVATIKNSLGNVEIDLVDDCDNYAMDLNVDIGDIEIDGNDVGEKYRTKGAGKKLTIEADLGDIEIE